MSRTRWGDEEIQMADRVVEAIKRYESSPCSYDAVGYPWLSAVTDLSVPTLKRIRLLIRIRCRVIYPGFWIEYNAKTKVFEFGDQTTPGQRTRFIGSVRSAESITRRASEIGDLNRSTPAEKLAGSMLKTQAEQLEMIRNFAKDEML